MAHAPQLMSEAQICLVSAQLGAEERYITVQIYSDWEFPRGCLVTFNLYLPYLYTYSTDFIATFLEYTEHDF